MKYINTRNNKKMWPQQGYNKYKHQEHKKKTMNPPNPQEETQEYEQQLKKRLPQWLFLLNDWLNEQPQKPTEAAK